MQQWGSPTLSSASAVVNPPTCRDAHASSVKGPRTQYAALRNRPHPAPDQLFRQSEGGKFRLALSRARVRTASIRIQTSFEATLGQQGQHVSSAVPHLYCGPRADLQRIGTAGTGLPILHLQEGERRQGERGRPRGHSWCYRPTRAPRPGWKCPTLGQVGAFAGVVRWRCLAQGKPLWAPIHVG